ncbi:tRNA (adenosine(37)-N6)-threonylcarbamoyltransferase complex ATPase subunit type 1 TsaE [Crocosphaera sp. XPORK-15E]|uniref:tRNA (adenosine(37)-N6)-threonylcarbamoyltransferase complex ATPase subunit type 1 TsaE n=1 Tax=Crocosphaera sp. XPORK-15E TaxID=3110247 RepID=UPI002B1F57FD|nr:tRNA (adenosine(37)-N6)-threonylcarbamoyltransferase complex ATPase subunit type 1 TsaE [Crocosphaera sp. XPORK-15E]MEA5535567.1 tRNA (adenosine(37)-N6)-threonylcarbamoyltransferase complex ATPase subunit type 1 TsaE [Crocosphaera sp. XPORK-15E]
MTIILQDAEATQALGKQLGESLSSGTVLLLKGALGAGKTTLVQGIGQGLDISDPIISPTFTLVNEYPQGRLPLYHLDLYRLQPQEVEGLYLEQYWEGEDVVPGITVIEWPEKLPYLPPAYLTIQLLYGEKFDRQAILTATENFTGGFPKFWEVLLSE